MSGAETAIRRAQLCCARARPRPRRRLRDIPGQSRAAADAPLPADPRPSRPGRDWCRYKTGAAGLVPQNGRRGPGQVLSAGAKPEVRGRHRECRVWRPMPAHRQPPQTRPARPRSATQSYPYRRRGPNAGGWVGAASLDGKSARSDPSPSLTARLAAPVRECDRRCARRAPGSSMTD